MLARYGNTRELPFYSPLSLFNWESPWRAFGSFRDDLNRLFGMYERSLAAPYAKSADSADLRDTGNELVISIDLPGVSKKDIELSLSGENVYVKASRTATEPEGYTTHRRERASYTISNMHGAFPCPSTRRKRRPNSKTAY
jgi:HSP20 family molecular chaperone IbpA